MAESGHNSVVGKRLRFLRVACSYLGFGTFHWARKDTASSRLRHDTLPLSMPLRNDRIGWTSQEIARLKVLSALGKSAADAASILNAEFHNGMRVRTDTAVGMVRTKKSIMVARPMSIPPQSADVKEQEVEVTQTEKGTEAKAVGKRIRTVDDLLKHIGADMTKYEVDKSEATKYEVATKDPGTGKVTINELHRVMVRLRPKAGPNVYEAVSALIAGAVKPRRPVPAQKHHVKSDIMQALVIADPHVGKYAWSHETGWEDYDVSIATRLLRDSAGELLADGNSRGVGRRVIMLLGDFFHYDTPHGATTKGTPLDRDGRVEKMLEAGSEVLFDIIEASASTVQTEVILVPGNHDTVLTIALRQILTAHFRGDRRVQVDVQGTTRKYIEHGKCLIGMTHGDKARKNLGEIMASEAPEAWGRSRYREIHTGHLHSTAEVQTIGGVVIRTAPALCPPDGWHAAEGFVGAPRGMESYYYHAAGSLVGMTMSSPDSHGKAPQNKRLHKPKG